MFSRSLPNGSLRQRLRLKKPTHLLGLLTVLLVNLAGCGFIDPSVATTVTLSPTTLSFSRFLETQQLTATVLDENGAEISNASLTWSTREGLNNPQLGRNAIGCGSKIRFEDLSER